MNDVQGLDFFDSSAFDLYRPESDLSFVDRPASDLGEFGSADLFSLGDGSWLSYADPAPDGFDFGGGPDFSTFDAVDTFTLPLMAGPAGVATADDWLGWEAGKALGDIGRSAWSTLQGWGSRAATFAEGLGPRLASGLLTAARFTPLGMMVFLEGDTPSGGDHFEQGPQIPPFTETLINQPGFHIGKEIFPARESHWSDGLLTHPFHDGPVLSDYSFPVHQSDWRDSLTPFPGDLLGHWSDSTYLAERHERDLPRIPWSDVGELLSDRGAQKRVFKLGTNEALGVSRKPGFTGIVDRELRELEKLHQYGIRGVNARGPVLVGDDPLYAGLIYEKRYAIGSKDFAVPDTLATRYFPTPFLTKTSLRDILLVRDSLNDGEILVLDFQMLFDGEEGHGDVADPEDVINLKDAGADPVYVDGLLTLSNRRLNGLIEAAQESIRLYPRW